MAAKPEPMTAQRALTIAMLFLEGEAQDARKRRVHTWAKEASEAAQVLRRLRNEVVLGRGGVGGQNR